MKWLKVITLILLSLTVKAPDRNFELEAKLEITWMNIYREMEYKKFKSAIKFHESGNDWKIINNINAMGYYQFTQGTLRVLGCDLDPELFKTATWVFPPSTQEFFMDELVNYHRKLLEPYIEKYNGKTIRGIDVTTSGLLAAAHIAGVGNKKDKTGVIGWLLYNHNPQDCNKTSLEDYLIKFSGYNF